MNQRDQNRGGRGGRYGSMRGEEGRYGDDRERDQEREEREYAHRSWTERLAAGYRDTYNPEPQWLREDRERAGGGDYERDTWGRGGTYAGTAFTAVSADNPHFVWNGTSWALSSTPDVPLFYLECRTTA